MFRPTMFARTIELLLEAIDTLAAQPAPSLRGVRAGTALQADSDGVHFLKIINVNTYIGDGRWAF